MIIEQWWLHNINSKFFSAQGHKLRWKQQIPHQLVLKTSVRNNFAEKKTLNDPRPPSISHPLNVISKVWFIDEFIGGHKRNFYCSQVGNDSSVVIFKILKAWDEKLKHQKVLSLSSTMYWNY